MSGPPDANDLYLRARTALDRALQLRSDLPEAKLDQGVLAFLYERKLSVAVKSFREAAELDRGYADAYAWQAAALSALGEHDLAIASMRLAQDLDPKYDDSSLGPTLYYNARRFDEALAAFKNCLAKHPNDPDLLWHTIALLARTGPDAETTSCLRLLVKADPNVLPADRATINNANPRQSAQLILEHMARAGVSADYRLLTRAGGSIFAGVDPAFDSVRGDRRFTQLVAEQLTPH